MTTREAQAEWQGSLKRGAGRLRLGSGLFEGSYSYPSRFEEASGTNPEELIAAAHAGCYVSRGRAIGPVDRPHGRQRYFADQHRYRNALDRYGVRRHRSLE